jgi:hypothetical protein
MSPAAVKRLLGDWLLIGLCLASLTVVSKLGNR